LIYYVSNIAGGANTVSVQLSGTVILRFAIHEYSGVTILDQVAFAQGNTGTNLSTANTAVTARPSEFVFALGITGDSVAYTVGAGYAQRQTVSGKLLTEDRVVNATGTYVGTAVMNPSSPWAMVVATFYSNSNQNNNQPPTVVTPASASPNPVIGKATNLSVLGADDGGESNLTYTRPTTGTPPAPVTFSSNATNASKSVTATFASAGTYGFMVTIRDASGLTTTSSVTAT